MNIHKTYWIKRFKMSQEFGHLRFKRIGHKRSSFSAQFSIEADLVDDVDEAEFLIIEENRIPLFLGSPLGIAPPLNNFPTLTETDRLVAIFCKSLLSGHVAGLNLAKLENGVLKNIIFFDNISVD